jgi:hypothetical protein
LKAPGFNPWNLKCDILVSIQAFACEFHLCRYTTGPYYYCVDVVIKPIPPRLEQVGAVQVACIIQL